jgi:pantoate--beta-alanine ligase
MKTIKSFGELKELLRPFKCSDPGQRTIGFVPTMGFLHQGHLELVEQSKKETDLTVVSIFVNPTQFAPGEDFDAYPRDLDRDAELLKERGVDVLFFPTMDDMYPEGYATYVEVAELGKVLCGKSRPTHFKGVTTIVLKLLNIVEPTHAYFGRKDAQQAVIIKKMVTDLNVGVTIRTIPIQRDPDGLALSSRNIYLSTEERAAALVLPRSLELLRKKIREGMLDVDELRQLFRREVDNVSLVEIDYIELVDLESLGEITVVDPDKTLVAAAVRVGKTRLIDNFILGEI